jgi:uncharacterized protein involved in oxidation of intracellular sulfur
MAKSDQDVQVFLMGDAVTCGMQNQQTPNGYYNIGRMIKGLITRGLPVHA